MTTDTAAPTTTKRGIARGALAGAAFLMATSAIGPGFLTQTTVFTQKMGASFGFVILLSIALDVVAQMAVWRTVSVSGKRAHELANGVVSGAGVVLALAVAAGGLAFNIGNVAGAGLGLNALTGIDPVVGAIGTAVLAVGLFVLKDAARAVDAFVRVCGVVMVGLIVAMVARSHPPLLPTLRATLVPDVFDARTVVTLVGGTVGGYITFAGAHRLVDAGLTGVGHLRAVTRSAAVGISVTAAIRYLLFLGTLGVIASGGVLDAGNPTSSVFELSFGDLGKRAFGLMMWAAAITSVIGSAYTSISFLSGLHPRIASSRGVATVAFIAVSTIVFALFGKPVAVLVIAGYINVHPPLRARPGAGRCTPDQVHGQPPGSVDAGGARVECRHRHRLARAVEPAVAPTTGPPSCEG